MSQISRLVRSLVYSRLSSVTIGYNAAVAAAQSNYGGDIDASRVTIEDWTPGAGNFLFGRVPPDSIESSSVLSYPVVTVDTLRTISGTGAQRWVMSDTFSGMIEAVVDVHISFSESSVLDDFASYGDLVEDAMFACLNNPSNVMSSSGIAYSGRLSLSRGPIVWAGQNWRQTLTFTVPFAASIA